MVVERFPCFVVSTNTFTFFLMHKYCLFPAISHSRLNVEISSSLQQFDIVRNVFSESELGPRSGYDYFNKTEVEYQ